MDARPLPSPAYLRQLLRYEPETGKLYWRERGPESFPLGRRWSPQSKADAWNTRIAGKEAGSIRPDGYLRVSVDDRLYYAHRLAWAVHFGVEPPKDIDHIDGDKLNNRLANLRLVEHIENMRNVKRTRQNTSGVAGVTWNKERKRWVARVALGNGARWQRRFSSLDDAMRAIAAKREELGYSKRHGS
jgi:hypothetical protein